MCQLYCCYLEPCSYPLRYARSAKDIHMQLNVQMMHAGYPGQLSDTRKKTDCKYHLEGRCSLGDKCPFRHVPVSSSNLML